MTIARRYPALLLFLMVLTAWQYCLADETEIPRANDFAETARLSQQQGVPIIVFVSRDACPYCRTLRDSVLVPMLAAKRFEQRASLVEVSLDRLEPLTDFDNEMISAGEFSERYGAGITPTLLFLDVDGREISKRRVGISNLEFYGHYLQKSIDEALAVTRSQVQ